MTSFQNRTSVAVVDHSSAPLTPNNQTKTQRNSMPQKKKRVEQQKRKQA